MTQNPMLDVLNQRKPSRRPIWFMRQAGRYLPEYRKIRAGAGSFLDLCYNPELACEVTIQPLRRFDIDAAILFADILVVPHAMGLDVRFEEGEGPVLEQVNDGGAVGKLKELAAAWQVKRVCETVAAVRAELTADKALIGFCGGPWTVASYMIEGGTSDRSRAKRAALEGFAWFSTLIDRLVEQSVEYLSLQVQAGAQVVQIFDSWAGELPGEAGEKFVTMPLKKMAAMLRQRHPDVPVIVFARGFGVRQLDLCGAEGVAALGIEAELPLKWIAREVRGRCVVQGNLDPVALQASEEIARRETRSVLAGVDMAGHIFNLGHGIRQGTDPEVVEAVVDEVRRFDKDG